MTFQMQLLLVSGVLFVFQDVASDPEQAEGGARSAGGAVQNCAEGSSYCSATPVSKTNAPQSAANALRSDEL